MPLATTRCVEEPEICPDASSERPQNTACRATKPRAKVVMAERLPASGSPGRVRADPPSRRASGILDPRLRFLDLLCEARQLGDLDAEGSGDTST
jgi:hypothetical protein